MAPRRWQRPKAEPPVAPGPPSLFDDPPSTLGEETRVRTSDPGTSGKGARDVTKRLGGQCALLLRTYAEAGAPLTSFEAGERSGLAARPGCCYWHRVSDLAALGLIAKTGVERVMPTGSAQAEFQITDLGRQKLTTITS